MWILCKSQPFLIYMECRMRLVASKFPSKVRNTTWLVAGRDVLWPPSYDQVHWRPRVRITYLAGCQADCIEQTQQGEYMPKKCETYCPSTRGCMHLWSIPFHSYFSHLTTPETAGSPAAAVRSRLLPPKPLDWPCSRAVQERGCSGEACELN